MIASGHRPVALVDQSIRPIIAKLAIESAADMAVLGTGEVMDAQIQVVGQIDASHLNEATAPAA